MKRQDQNQLAALIRKGSFNLYEQIMQQYIKRVFSICFAECADINKAEKLCEEIFLAVFHKIISEKNITNLKELIDITSKNLSKNSYDSQLQIGDELILSIRALPEQFRKVLILYYFNDRDIASVCHLLGMDSTNFRNCLKDARKHLKAIVEPCWREYQCSKWSEQIDKFIIDLLTTQEAIDVQQHINECSKCRKYLELLNDDDKKITDVVHLVQDLLEQIITKTMSKISADGAKQKAVGNLEIRRKMLLVIPYFVVFVIVVLLAAVFIYKSDLPEPVQQVEEPVIIEQVQNSNSDQNKKDLERVMQCALSKDIDGLIIILQTAQQPAKLLAQISQQMPKKTKNKNFFCDIEL